MGKKAVKGTVFTIRTSGGSPTVAMEQFSTGHGQPGVSIPALYTSLVPRFFVE